MIFRIILMSISLSIDALGIGISYQLKGVKIGFIPRILIGMVSTCIMGISLLMGQKMLEFFPNGVTEKVGAAILVIVGCVFIRNALFGSEESICDLDKSKDINWLEALLMGFALSMDCLSIGIAAATFPIQGVWMSVCVGIMQFFFLWAGKLLADKKHFQKGLNGKKSGIFAGTLLIIMGIFRNI